MDKIIYFNNDHKNDSCTKEIYYDFIDYAFSKADSFMLVYVNYYGKGYTKIMKSFRNELNPYKIKSRTNPSWPGTLSTQCRDTTYKIEFYKTCPEAKDILKRVKSFSEWSRPTHPEDLAFFRGNQCWFYSVGHEEIAAIIHADADDIKFVVSKSLANREDAFDHKDNYFDSFDENLLT